MRFMPSASPCQFPFLYKKPFSDQELHPLCLQYRNLLLEDGAIVLRQSRMAAPPKAMRVQRHATVS